MKTIAEPVAISSSSLNTQSLAQNSSISLTSTKPQLWTRYDKNKNKHYSWYVAQTGNICDCPECSTEDFCEAILTIVVDICLKEIVKYNCSMQFCNGGQICDLVAFKSK